ncbi:hypothetical protein SAMN05444405_104204 [Bacteroides luti]|uniref:Curlin associated repeat-containing protein n=1 Tax=Bacteroides luti TaxID=1297750 RepID=A0A1M4Y3I6_9BACE|nr:hypothetical protein [Bacteroides luti]SHF00311.1 hypothetical protein SAMN05444405_104204 [Bacteroides luti]
MKKLIFLFAALFTAGFAMGQNIVYLTQTGLANDASVSQTGSNTATVLQETLLNAKNNDATILQNGFGNTSYSKQHQQAGITAAQDVFVTQIGNGNAATQIQGIGYTGYNYASIGQYTSNNTGYQYQDGYNLSAKINQSGNNANQGSQVQQGSHQYAVLTQVGYSNIGNQNQNGLNHYAEITSTGDRNQASQSQNGGNWNSPPASLGGHSAIIKQFNGNDNTAIQSQTGLQNNHSTITQDGYSNYSNQSLTGSSNNAEIYQYGINNIAYQTIDGDNNNQKLFQTGGGTAYITQKGMQNVVKGLSTNAYGFDATWAKFTGSWLSVNQNGDKNSLALEADGIVTVTQDNSALISKVGNTIEFSQAGGGTSTLTQVGDENLIKLTKTGGGTAYLDQEGNVNKVAMFDDVFGATPVVNSAALFNGSSLTVTQTGDANLLNLDSTSAGAIVNVSQVGTNRASVIQH